MRTTASFALWQIAVLLLGALVLGVVLSAGRAKDRKSRPVARFIAFLAEPVYYWCDLFGPDGRPSHSKVAYFITLLTMLAEAVRLGLQEVELHSISLNFVIFAAMVMAYGLGRAAYNAFLHHTLGSEKLQQFMTARQSGTTVVPPGVES